MKKQDKVIITCAITGAIHTPCMSPYLPVNPEQIAEHALAAAEAGAAMIHFHARDPKDGFPTTDLEAYEQFLPVVKNNCDAIINITSNQPSRRFMETGNPQHAFEDRMAAPMHFSPEVCSFNLGPLLPAPWAFKDKYWDKTKYEWERMMMSDAAKGAMIINTYEHMEYIAREMGEKRGTRFEFECFDIGHLHALRFIADQGWVKPPFFIQTILGFHGGLGTRPDHLMHYRKTADELFGDDYHWSILAAGANQMKMVTIGAAMGGNVRVGMEDSLWYGKGELAQTNAQQVGRIRRIMEELSLEIATPDEAREILQTKGPNDVNI